MTAEPRTTFQAAAPNIPAETRIGHVHLKVSDLDRAVWFYHEAIYLHDPDGNGIELAWDRDPSYWHLMPNPSPEALRSRNKPLDFDGLLGELGDPDADRYLPTLRQYR